MIIKKKMAMRPVKPTARAAAPQRGAKIHHHEQVKMPQLES